MTTTTTCFCHSCIGIASGRTPEEAQCAHCGAPTGEPRAAHWIAYSCSEACQRALDAQEDLARASTLAEEALSEASDAARALSAAIGEPRAHSYTVELPWLRGLAQQGLLRPGVRIARERARDFVREVSALATCPVEWTGVAEARALLAPAQRLLTILEPVAL